ncbi:MAG TPA: hypothetical protein VNR00_11530 [Opitutus sp.]|nr:hypothetical protein [Opitutus sp.]
MTHSLRAFVALVVVLSSLGLSGCENVPTRVRERFEAPQPQLRIYQAEQRAVFDAALRASKRIGFTVSRSGAAQGVIKAHSALRPGDAFGKARQNSIDVKIETLDPGLTQVAVVLREQEESESFAGATDLPLRQHALYAGFFGGLDAELGQTGIDPTSEPLPVRPSEPAVK